MITPLIIQEGIVCPSLSFLFHTKRPPNQTDALQNSSVTRDPVLVGVREQNQSHGASVSALPPPISISTVIPALRMMNEEANLNNLKKRLLPSFLSHQQQLRGHRQNHKTTFSQLLWKSGFLSGACWRFQVFHMRWEYEWLTQPSNLNQPSHSPLKLSAFTWKVCLRHHP